MLTASSRCAARLRDDIMLEGRGDCQHEPNARGTQCQHCGIPAEMVAPDELAEALSAALIAVERSRLGQVGNVR